MDISFKKFSGTQAVRSMPRSNNVEVEERMLDSRRVSDGRRRRRHFIGPDTVSASHLALGISLGLVLVITLPRSRVKNPATATDVCGSNFASTLHLHYPFVTILSYIVKCRAPGQYL